jgi:arginase family enzyme
MDPAKGIPVLLGIPFDANSSYLRGPAEAPPVIREALRCDGSNGWTETCVDLDATEHTPTPAIYSFPRTLAHSSRLKNPWQRFWARADGRSV